MAYGFIYITTNKVNGIRYIGQHTRFNDNYLGSGTVLNKAIEKYGRENFEREIIAYANSQEELDELERMYIKKYNAVEDPMFYNIAEGGNVINYWKGKKRDEETKRKISENNGMKDLEVRERMREIMIGREVPALKGKGHLQKGAKNPMYGRRGRSHIEINLLNKDTGEIINFDTKYKAERWLMNNGYEISNKAARKKLQNLIETKTLLDGKYLFSKG